MMYMDDDTLTPRDRIGDEMLRRMLDSDGRSLSDSPSERARQPHHTNPRATWGLADHPLAMVYAPLQQFRNLYDRDTALRQGTIFEELDLDFLGESVADRHKGGSCRD